MFNWMAQKLHKPSHVAGLDIGTSSVKLLHLSAHNNGYRIEDFSFAAIPSGAIFEKEIKNETLVGYAITEANERLKTPIKNVAIALPDASSFTKIIQVDTTLADDEIEYQAKIEISRYLSYPSEEINLDFQIKGLNLKDPQLLDVLLVASHKKNVDAYLSCVTASGLNVSIIDIQSFAIERALGLIQKQLPESEVPKTAAVVDIGATETTVTIVRDGNSLFSRSELFGGHHLTKAIQQYSGITFAEAEIIKLKAEFSPELEEKILDPFVEQLTLQIRRAFQYFYSSNHQGDIQKIFLAGGTALLSSMAMKIEEKIGINVLLADPFIAMNTVRKTASEDLQYLAPRFLLSCGLAMRQFDVKEAGAR